MQNDTESDLAWALSHFTYSKEDGILRHKIQSRYGISVGDPVGHTHQSQCTSYLMTKRKRKNVQVHNIIWLMVIGDWPKGYIDHIDGNGLNNCWDNLRDVPEKENLKNKRRYRVNTSGVPGVYFRLGRWYAVIRVDGYLNHLGSFLDKDYAVQVRREAELRFDFHPLHGTDKGYQ